tara:strand:+ start:45 stop:221 length:177 start_codon:yes stop_codon:yes gene_type:complete
MFEIIGVTMIEGEGDLIAELLCITGELGGKMERLTTYDSNGRTTKKIVIEYDEKLQSR